MFLPNNAPRDAVWLVGSIFHGDTRIWSLREDPDVPGLGWLVNVFLVGQKGETFFRYEKRGTTKMLLMKPLTLILGI